MQPIPKPCALVIAFHTWPNVLHTTQAVTTGQQRDSCSQESWQVEQAFSPHIILRHKKLIGPYTARNLFLYPHWNVLTEVKGLDAYNRFTTSQNSKLTGPGSQSLVDSLQTRNQSWGTRKSKFSLFTFQHDCWHLTQPSNANNFLVNLDTTQ